MSAFLDQYGSFAASPQPLDVEIPRRTRLPGESFDFRDVSWDDFLYLEDVTHGKRQESVGNFGFPQFQEGICPLCGCRKFGATLMRQPNGRFRLFANCRRCCVEKHSAEYLEVARRVVAIFAGDPLPPNVASAERDDPETWRIGIADYVYPGWTHGMPLWKQRFINNLGKKPCVIRYFADGRWQYSPANHGFPALYDAPVWHSAPLGEVRDIFLVEGEKDCETLKALGLWATTQYAGAEGRWYPAYTELLRGWRCFVLPDLDPVGLIYAGRVMNALQGAGIDCYLVRLPGPEGDGFDVSDWIKAGGTREELLTMAAAAVAARKI